MGLFSKKKSPPPKKAVPEKKVAPEPQPKPQKLEPVSSDKVRTAAGYFRLRKAKAKPKSK